MNPSILLLPLTVIMSCSQQNKKGNVTNEPQENNQHIGGPCECCEGIYEDMPDFLRWETTVADETEGGEKLHLSGRVLSQDGNPAEEVILYVYHTNSEGIYTPAEGQSGCARRHGKLRGWMKTNEKGEYAFHTILPGSYPNSTEPRHIHVFIKEKDKNEYWIDSFLFDNDPFLTDVVRKQYDNRGGSGVVTITKDAENTWTGKRDIVLGKNVEGY